MFLTSHLRSTTNFSEYPSYVHLGREANMVNDLVPELRRSSWEVLVVLWSFQQCRRSSEEEEEHPAPCPPSSTDLSLVAYVSKT